MLLKVLFLGLVFQFTKTTSSEYVYGTYSVNHPLTSVRDPVSGAFLSFDILPHNIEKRDTEDDDKSALKKINTIKKPNTLLIKTENVTTVTSTKWMNKTQQLDTTTTVSTPVSSPPSISNTILSSNSTTFKVKTARPIVLDVIPVNVSYSSNSIPGSNNNSSTIGGRSNNIGSKTPTLPDLWFPDFPISPENDKNYTIKNDTHRYYTSSYYQHGEFLWVDLDNNPNAATHELLSNAHRRASTIKLEFEFPFYGHSVTNVTMATGGFIYLGDQVHAWLAATQYVAPLMANFDSRVANTSSVRYLSNATQFTVEWNQVHLHNATDLRPFTFQLSLYINGTIVFAYKEIPFQIKELNDTQHPVKVGLSDAYITDKTILFVKSRTIFEYDRVDLKDYKILNGSGIIFTALPTCLTYKSCQECTSHKTLFNCVWCPRATRCSDGTDRHRQDWLIKSCTYQSFDTHISCFIGTTSTESSDTYHNFAHEDHDHDHDDHDHLNSPTDEQYNHDKNTMYSSEKVTHNVSSATGMSASGVMGLLLFLSILFGVGGWVLYAYYYPHSPSGQLLIRFRPSQWGAFRRGEARYTAASIHM